MKKSPMHQNASALIFQRARVLRNKETQAEQELWKHLKGKKLDGFKFRRQHPFDRYILDFYCNERKLVVELDGEYQEDELQKWQDEERTIYLKNSGLDVLRFQNKEIFNDMETVLWKIREELIGYHYL